MQREWSLDEEDLGQLRGVLFLVRSPENDLDSDEQKKENLNSLNSGTQKCYTEWRKKFAELKKIKVKTREEYGQNAGGKRSGKEERKIKPRGSGVESDGCERIGRKKGVRTFRYGKQNLSRGWNVEMDREEFPRISTSVRSSSGSLIRRGLRRECRRTPIISINENYFRCNYKNLYQSIDSTLITSVPNAAPQSGANTFISMKIQK